MREHSFRLATQATFLIEAGKIIANIYHNDSRAVNSRTLYVQFTYIALRYFIALAPCPISLFTLLPIATSTKKAYHTSQTRSIVDHLFLLTYKVFHRKVRQRCPHNGAFCRIVSTLNPRQNPQGYAFVPWTAWWGFPQSHARLNSPCRFSPT